MWPAGGGCGPHGAMYRNYVDTRLWLLAVGWCTVVTRPGAIGARTYLRTYVLDMFVLTGFIAIIISIGIDVAISLS